MPFEHIRPPRHGKRSIRRVSDDTAKHLLQGQVRNVDESMRDLQSNPFAETNVTGGGTLRFNPDTPAPEARDKSGVVFDSRIHTGSKLKSGNWRTRKEK